LPIVHTTDAGRRIDVPVEPNPSACLLIIKRSMAEINIDGKAVKICVVGKGNESELYKMKTAGSLFSF
jgi:hypothetical protein